MNNPFKKPKPITKAVIVAAGYGTRFLPATKNQPKEMLPIIDKPILHYAVEEAVASGIKTIILVTRAGNNVIEDYFDNNYELEKILENAGKTEYLEMISDIPQMAEFIYVRQRKHLPYGNGTPLLVVKELIDDDEPFVYMFGDDMTLADKPVTKQLMNVYEKEKPEAVLGVQEVPVEEIHRYGSIEYKSPASFEMKRGHEKLSKEEAPSNMAQFGRFVFSPAVIEEAQKTSTGKGGELWIIDIINGLAEKGEKVIAQPIAGEWLTTGDPLCYLKTMLKFAMKREEFSEDLLEFLKTEIVRGE